ncbi:MAG: glycoside hydrolase family 127 protein [Candidatus Bathyarchaeia archaeon]
MVSFIKADAIKCTQPNKVRMKGFIGKRFEANRLNRLRLQEEYFLLWPFQEHCPIGYGYHQPHPDITLGDWHGEFLGTWVSAASLTAWNTSDEELCKKIDILVRNWLATQKEDGYLGTYDEKDRWKSWDVWVQAHDLIGLLTYYHYTGREDILKAAIRVADRVLKDFGPGKRPLHKTGPHRGMASSAILEPLIWLYWETGDKRYLEFGRWLVDEDWEQPDGPRLISSLLSGLGVAGTPCPKGVEMLIDFAGLLELYRATGEERYLKTVLVAWEDIVRNHLYITGSASTGEYFTPDFVLRNDGVFRIGETCVTMGWIYLNLSLGKLTGEARFFDMVEQSLYNHLLGAQSPDGRGWAYYVGLRDSKRYRWHTDPECCPSRGTRMLALMPLYVFGVDNEGIVVNFYEKSEATLTLNSGVEVKIEQETSYPFDGEVLLKFALKEPSYFTVRLRLPGWCEKYEVRLNDEPIETLVDARGYIVVDRVWCNGDTLRMNMDMPVRVVIDKFGNNLRVAFMRGPLVFAADSSYLPERCLLDDIVVLLDPIEPAKNIRVLKDENMDTVHLVVPVIFVEPNKSRDAWRGERYCVLTRRNGEKKITKHIELVPFFEAGNKDPICYLGGVSRHIEPVINITYQVWLPYIWA